MPRSKPREVRKGARGALQSSPLGLGAVGSQRAKESKGEAINASSPQDGRPVSSGLGLPGKSLCPCTWGGSRKETQSRQSAQVWRGRHLYACKMQAQGCLTHPGVLPPELLSYSRCPGSKDPCRRKVLIFIF